jgi:endonuclease/exonuclease/phosphatase family metal-dependent hydrolase
MAKLSQPKKKLSLISFNVFGAPFHAQKVFETLFTTHVYRRLAYLTHELNASQSDVLALQEVNTYLQYLFLRRRLKKYPYVCYKKFLFGPKGGVVTFSKIPFTRVEYVTFKNRGVYWNKSFIADLIRRGMLVGKLKDLPISIINTHITHNIDHDYSPKNRFIKIQEAQLAQIAVYLQSIIASSNSVLLSGDFNIPKDSKQFPSFLKAAALTDVFHEYHESTYHPEYVFHATPLGRIDHIFLYQNGRNIKITDKKELFTDTVTLSNKVKTHLSDHIGLFASFEIPV